MKVEPREKDRHIIHRFECQTVEGLKKRVDLLKQGGYVIAEKEQQGDFVYITLYNPRDFRMVVYSLDITRA